jgi:hypothetical protein
MTGRQVNIYLQEKNYEAVRKLVGPRQISHYINQALEEKLSKEQNKGQQEFQQKLISGYKRVAKSKNLRQEEKIWEVGIEDVLK